MKKRHLFVGLAILPVLIYLLGPRQKYPDFDANLPSVDWSLQELEHKIMVREQNEGALKPNNEARIIWADSIRKTEYAIVYLHGFSASPMEGDPVHSNVAKRYGCNLYLPRFPQHGFQTKESFYTLSPKDMIDGAKEALAIGQLLGEKVILMSCSTGSTLSVYLAEQHPKLIHSLIMYSPNFAIEDSKAKLLTYPWGLQIARKVIGDYRRIHSMIDTELEQFTTCEYRVEGVICLQTLLDKTMTEEAFRQIDHPYFIGYYYKNEKEKDGVISLDAIRKFNQLTKTDDNKKRIIVFENGTHVLPSELQNDHYQEVQRETFNFVEHILKLKPKIAS